MNSNYNLIHHFLEQSARRFPDKTALIHGDIRATYTQINSQANNLAKWLIDQGVARGDRVVILLENSLEYVVSYYGILKAGAVAVPLSTGIKPDGLNSLLCQLEPSAIISSKKFEKRLHALIVSPPSRPAVQPSDLPATDDKQRTTSNVQALIQNSKLIIKNCSFALKDYGLDITQFDDIVTTDNTQLATNSFQSPININESELASIVYTSGSTGQPKGVMLSHKNIVSNTKAICEYLHLTDDDIQMVVLPFFYVMGKSLLNTHIAVGGTVVLNNKFAFPAAVLKEMEKEQVTGFSGVPSTYAYLLHRSPLASYRARLPSLRYCSQAGGHMSQQIKEQLRQVLPGHTKIYIMYGATEASARLTYLDPERFEDKMGSIGRPVPGVTIRVEGTDGEEMPPGHVGELVASGPNIMQGYWNDPEGTSHVLDDHGYHTGDFGYQDQEGFLFVQGRKDDLLKVGGHRINPMEIEDVILSTDLVIEAVVLGIPDNLLGHRLVAVAAPKNGDCNSRDIRAYCAENLPKHKVPGEVKLVRALPKNSSGKINRNKCAELILNS